MYAKKLFSLIAAWIIFTPVLTFAGSITGTITYQGDVPQFKPIKMDADPICVSHHTEAVYPEPLVLGEGNTMANVFVQIKSGLASKDFPVPTEPVIVTQAGCQYSPHVFVVRAGQPLKFLNPDGTLHNVHAIPKLNTEFNMAMPKFRKDFERVFDKPEAMFPIKCDVHPWMLSYCAVVDHPFFAVTGKDGTYEIQNLGPGTYEVEAWQEKLGTQSTTITISGDQSQTADFIFTKPTA